MTGFSRVVIALAALILLIGVEAAIPFMRNNKIKKHDILSDFEVSRAKTWTPRSHYRGNNLTQTNKKLNQHLQTYDNLATKACGDHTLEEMWNVLSVIYAARHPELNDIYQESQDPRALLFANADEFSAAMESDLNLVDQAPYVHDTLRQARCHDAVMWFIHHLSEDAKQEVSQLISLPLLPVEDAGSNLDTSDESSLKASDALVSSQTCQQCHVSSSKISTVPEWPDQFTANFGAYYTNTPDGTTKSNVTSKLYFDNTIPAMTIYHSTCPPNFYPQPLQYETLSDCYYFFQNSNLYFYGSTDSRGTKGCCALGFTGIVVSKNKLTNFESKGDISTTDYWGNKVVAEEWDDKFGLKFYVYTDKDTGYDMYFKDGASDLYWRIGDYDESKPDSKYFTLPSSCSSSCGGPPGPISESHPFFGLGLVHHNIESENL